MTDIKENKLDNLTPEEIDKAFEGLENREEPTELSADTALIDRSETGLLARLSSETNQEIRDALETGNGTEDIISILDEIKNEHVKQAETVAPGQDQASVIKALTEKVTELYDAYRNAVPPDSVKVKALEKFLNGLRVEHAEEDAKTYDARLETARTGTLEEVVTSEYGKSFMEMMESGAYDEDIPKGEQKLAELTDLASQGKIGKAEAERLRMEWDKIAGKQEMGQKTEIGKKEGEESLEIDDSDIDNLFG